MMSESESLISESDDDDDDDDGVAELPELTQLLSRGSLSLLTLQDTNNYSPYSGDLCPSACEAASTMVPRIYHRCNYR